MGFRDENEALRARIQTLESETEQLRDEKKELEDELAGRGKDAEEELAIDALLGPSHSSLAAHVQDRKARELAEQRKSANEASQKRARAIARLRERKKRVRVAAGNERKIIRFDRGSIRDRLKAQLPWGFGFAFVNPGVFIMMGLGFLLGLGVGIPFPWVIPATIITWMTILFSINLAYARVNDPKWRLELTDEHFALFRGEAKKPQLFGSLGELKVRAPDPDQAKLHTVRISDGRSEAEVEYLVADDVALMKEALGKVGQR